MRVATDVVAVEHPLVNTARNSDPDCDGVGEKASVVLVAPGTFANAAPPLVLTCHWTVGVGLPLAAAVKVTLDAGMFWLTGLVVTTGAVFTVKVAAEDVAELQLLVKTA